MAFRTFHCEIQTLSGMWDPFPDQETNTDSLPWEHRSLSHWTTREDPISIFIWDCFYFRRDPMPLLLQIDLSYLLGLHPHSTSFGKPPLDFCDPAPNSASSHLVFIVALRVTCCSTGGLLFPSQTQLPKDRPCIVPFPCLAPSMIMPWAGHWQALRKHLVSGGPDG